MKRKKRKTTLPRGRTAWHLESGQCFVCSCTDLEACPGGCSWSNKDRTICSSCADELASIFMTFMARKR